MRAFWDLTTERPGGMAAGLIPWSKAVQYGHHAGLDDDMINPFVAVIRAMDAKYVEWQDAEAERRRRQGRGLGNHEETRN